MDCQGAQSKKEGREDQGNLKKLGGVPPIALLTLPGPPGLLLALGSLAIHQAITMHQVILMKPAAQGPGISANGADAGGCGGGQSPPPPKSFFMGTLRAQTPKGSKRVS